MNDWWCCFLFLTEASVDARSKKRTCIDAESSLIIGPTLSIAL